MLTQVSISFAYQSFKWSNNAKNNAGVTVVIIGLSGKNTAQKKKILVLHYSVLIEISVPFLCYCEIKKTDNCQYYIPGNCPPRKEVNPHD